MTRSDSHGAEPLRDKEERFAQLYALGLPALEAAQKAGWRWNGSPQGNAGNARKIAHRPSVRARVAYLRANRDKEAMAELRHIVHDRLMLWHEVDIAEFYETREEEVMFEGEAVMVLDDEGRPVRPLTRLVQRLKNFADMTIEQRKAIKGLKWTETGRPNLELYSALDANRDLRKMNGFDAPTQVEDKVSISSDAALDRLVESVATLAAKLRAMDDENAE
jgi:hypothetical protein